VPRPPRRRRNRRRAGVRPADEQQRDATSGEQGPPPAGEREPRPPRDREERRGGVARGSRQGERGRRDQDQRRRPGGGRDRERRDERQSERKLYSTDSIVDRGFEDVEEETGTRRVHWTIVKRTVADQISHKAMSATYVLQRDGIDTEFPSLGAARTAVAKTIVHPEKLTMSKAEHAAQKGGSR
jgi:hypothetical protein